MDPLPLLYAALLECAADSLSRPGTHSSAPRGVFAVLSRQASLEEEYVLRVRARAAASRGSARVREAHEAAVGEGLRALKANVASLVRALREAPPQSASPAAAVLGGGEAASEREELASALRTAAASARGGGSWEALASAAVAAPTAGAPSAGDSGSSSYRTPLDDEALVAEVQALASAMDSEGATAARETVEHREELHALTEELRRVRARADAGVRLAHEVASGRAQTAGAGAAAAAAAAAALGEALEEATVGEEAAHSDSMALLRAQHEALAAVVSRWREREAVDTAALGAELALAQAVRAGEVQELARLRARFAADAAEAQQRRSAVSAALAAEARSCAAAAAREAAATMLQKLVGGMHAELAAAAAALAESPKKGSNKKK